MARDAIGSLQSRAIHFRAPIGTVPTLSCRLFTLIFVLLLPTASRADDLDAAALTLQARQGKAIASDDAGQLALGMVNFGFTIQRILSEQGTVANTTVSPFSIVSAFGLLANGARGETEASILAGLQLTGMTRRSFDDGYLALTNSLHHSIGSENTLSFANALFVATDFRLREAYTHAVTLYFGAAVEPVNFGDESATAHINDYIANHTGGMIRDLLPRLPSETRSVLANAGYFKGTWAIQFSTTQTNEEGKFSTGKGMVSIPMMNQRDEAYLYYRGEDFRMATLAYKNGDFAFDLIVPDWQSGQDAEEALRKVQQQLNGANYLKALTAEEPVKLALLSLPRFEVEYVNTNLAADFATLMPGALSGDFGDLSADEFRIGLVAHATEVKVNEEGTEGAFVTAMTLSRGPRDEDPLRYVVADHPFIFVIRHTESGVPLFIGTVREPKGLPKAK
jgi:serpin B